MASCKEIDDLKKCAKGEDCSNCVMTGNRQELTVIKSDVTFIEQLPSVNLGKKTAMQLVPQLFKYGSSEPVDYSDDQAFTTKDTLVLAIRPQDSRSFSGEQFALTCPDKYLAAYNPMSAHCTTSAAVTWTYTGQNPLLAAEEEACDNGQTCKECEDNAFPLGLAKQSVLFDGAKKVRICANRTHVLRTHEVAMMDYVHMMWLGMLNVQWLYVLLTRVCLQTTTKTTGVPIPITSLKTTVILLVRAGVSAVALMRQHRKQKAATAARMPVHSVQGSGSYPFWLPHPWSAAEKLSSKWHRSSWMTAAPTCRFASTAELRKVTQIRTAVSRATTSTTCATARIL